jgi:hypothetical protein
MALMCSVTERTHDAAKENSAMATNNTTDGVEITEYWIAQNRARRDAGRDHCTVLRDTTMPSCPIVATIEEEVVRSR